MISSTKDLNLRPFAHYDGILKYMFHLNKKFKLLERKHIYYFIFNFNNCIYFLKDKNTG